MYTFKNSKVVVLNITNICFIHDCNNFLHRLSVVVSFLCTLDCCWRCSRTCGYCSKRHPHLCDHHSSVQASTQKTQVYHHYTRGRYIMLLCFGCTVCLCEAIGNNSAVIRMPLTTHTHTHNFHKANILSRVYRGWKIMHVFL